MRLALLLAAAACSSKPAAQPDPKAAAPSLESLIAADTNGVFRQPGSEMFVLRYVDQLITGIGGKAGAPACWPELTKRVKTGYQLSLAKGSAYFIVEGDLPPEQVTACLKRALQDDAKQEGDLYSIATPVGTAFAAWRGPYVVIGNREQVEAALKTPTAETTARWHELTSAVAGSPWYMVRTDHIDDLVGAHTTSYAFAMDKVQMPPNPFFAGRFIIHYATPADAEAGEHLIRDWSGRGEFPRRIPNAAAMQSFDALAVGVQKTKITRSATTVEIAFDSDMFGGAEALGAALSKFGASQ
jgi:hypothetical protein